MTAQQQIFCIHFDPHSNKWTINESRWYQIDAVNKAEVFYQDPQSAKQLYLYNNQGFVFRLKKHHYQSTYEMTKEDGSKQYLMKGTLATARIYADLQEPSLAAPTQAQAQTQAPTQAQAQTSDKKPCPLCNATIHNWARYPRSVCGDCAALTVTANGDKIEFYNPYVAGSGFASIVNGQKGEEHICYINGNKCYADEFRFGGIVVSYCV